MSDRESEKIDIAGEPAALRPPKQWEHLPEHLLHHKNGALVRCFWHEITAWSFYPGGLPVDSDVMAERGWIYLQPHGPCTPDAIVPDPEDEEQLRAVIEALMSSAIANRGNRDTAKSVLTALRDAARGAGG